MALTEIDLQPSEPICMSDVQIPTRSARATRVGTIAGRPAGASADPAAVAAARRQHCQLSWSLANALDIPFGTRRADRVQVRVGVVSGGRFAGSSAVYTVAGVFWSLRPEIRFHADQGAEAGGARRLYGAAAPVGARTARIQVFGRAPSVLHPQDFEEPCSPRRHYFTEPSEADPETAGSRWFEEWIEKVSNTDILLMAPHGGEIEAETDRQAEETLEFLVSANVIPNLWACRGEWGGGSADRWHVADTDVGETGFPGLAELLDSRRYRHAVAFHGFSWAPGPGVILGGRAGDGLKRFVQEQIEVNCANAGRGGELAYYLASTTGAHFRIPAANGNSIAEATAGGRKALDAERLVNRRRVAGCGLHLEQSSALLRDPVLRQAVARAVATALYMELYGPSGA